MLRIWALMPSSTVAMGDTLSPRRGSWAGFGEAAGEELAFGRGRAEGERGPVGVAGLGGTAELAQQVGPARVHEVPARGTPVAAQIVQNRQAGGGPLSHRHGDRPVGVHHRGWLVAGQSGVEGGYLRPVGVTCLRGGR